MSLSMMRMEGGAVHSQGFWGSRQTSHSSLCGGSQPAVPKQEKLL